MSFAPLLPQIGVEHTTHAYLFETPNAALAREQVQSFASHMLCEKKSACGSCEPCTLVAAFSHPDFLHIAPEKNHITIERVRDLSYALQMKPVLGDKKIVWIEQADTMGIPAQNALLKTLEEPAPYAILIMTTANSKRMLQTIRSRARRVYLGGPKESDAIDYKKLADILVDVGNGDVNRAFSVFSFFQEYQENKEELIGAVEYLLKEILLFKTMNVRKNVEHPWLVDKANASRMSPGHIVRVLDICRYVRDGLGRNINFQLSMERIMIEMLEDQEWSK